MDDREILMKIKGAPSRYVTWVDYSIRMKQSTVSPEDYEHFYRKYYGFVIGFCRKQYHLNDWQISDIIDLVFDKFISSARKQFDHRKGRFRSWFATLIGNVIKDYLEREAKQGKGTPNAKDSSFDIEEIPDNESGIEDAPDDETMWKSYMAYLAWESVVEKSRHRDPKPLQCFIWRHYYNKKPAEIAQILDISSQQVSEYTRSFKDKLLNALRNLDETYKPDEVNWEELKRTIEEAKKRYTAIAEEFPIIVKEDGNEIR